jgi:hypothetical protein
MGFESHKEIQELLVNKIFRILSYVTIPILLINLSRYFILGWLPTFNYYIIVSFFILVISLNATKLPYSFKVFFLIFIFSSFAVSQGLNFGMVGFMAEFLILIVFIGVIFLQKKSAFIFYVLSGFLCACCAFLSIKGVIPLVPDFEKHINSIPSWSSYLVTFLFLTTIIIFIAGDIGNLLAEKMKALEEKNAELIAANEEVLKLQGILPICSSCKKIRDDKGYWYQVESYIESHSDAKFSHGLCEECSEKLYGKEEWYIKKKRNEKKHHNNYFS